MDTVKKTTKNIAKSNRVIANKFNIDDEDFYKNKKESTILRDIAKTNNYIAGRLSSVNEPNGLVELDENGMINSDQLPSYVDDAVEGYYYNGAFYSDSSHQYEIVPESGKIYIDITYPDHAQSYRWTGSTYSIIADPREALFDVTFTEPVPGNLNSDKTLSEIEEAVNSGKVVRGFFGNITYYLTSIQHDTNVKFNAAIKNINYNIEGKYLNNVWNWSYNSLDLSNIKPDWNATAGADNEILNKPAIEPLIINYVSAGTNGFQSVVDTNIETIYNAVQDKRLIYYKTSSSATYIYILNPVVCAKNDQNKYKLVFQLICINLIELVHVSQTKFYYQQLVCTTNANSFSADWVDGNSVYLSKTGYVNQMRDYTLYGTCSTEDSTSIKVCNVNLEYYGTRGGTIIGILFTYTNTAENPQFKVSSLTKNIKYNGQIITNNNLDKAGKAGHVIYYMYDGTYWVWMGEDNTFSGSYNDLTDKPIPTPTQSDSGKLLSVDASGNYELITIVNSENIAY